MLRVACLPPTAMRPRHCLRSRVRRKCLAPTITAIFGTKAGLLTALVQLVVGGDEEPIALVDRPWWQAMLAEPDARQQLAVYAANGRQIHERSADVAAIMQGAATADPEIAEMLRQLAEGRFRMRRPWPHHWRRKARLPVRCPLIRRRHYLGAQARTICTACSSSNVGWAPQQYEQWLAASLIHALLDTDGQDKEV